ncbi:MAG TPA: glycosyltransferase family 4 protein, partial [Mycobacteriales bacterium]
RGGGPMTAPTPTAGHVLVVVENIPLAVDHRVRKQVTDLAGAGYRVSVVTRRHPDNRAYGRLPGLRLLEFPDLAEPGGAAGYAREYAAAFLWAAVRSAGARLSAPVDVVQLCQPPDIYFPLAHLLRWSGAAVLVDQRDLMPELYTARYARDGGGLLPVLRWLERRTQRSADWAITVNDHLVARMIGAGARPERLRVVRNGPVLSRVRAARPDPALRAGRDLLCCWVGKMGRQDRLDLLVQAIAGLVHGLGRRDCHFALLGDGECLDEVRAQVTELGLDPWVSCPGWLPESDVFAFLATADVGLDTSLQEEVSPVKAMEYVAFGLPVVAFDLAQTRPLVDGAGVLVPPGDLALFAKETAALLDDPVRRAALGDVGRRRAVEELCWERQSEVYLDVMDRAARAARRRRAQSRSSWIMRRRAASVREPDSDG